MKGGGSGSKFERGVARRVNRKKEAIELFILLVTCGLSPITATTVHLHHRLRRHEVGRRRYGRRRRQRCRVSANLKSEVERSANLKSEEVYLYRRLGFCF